MSMKDKMIEACLPYMDSFHADEAANAIIAALPDMIEPLVWVTTKYGVSAPDYFIMHILSKNTHRVYGIKGEWDSSAEFDTLEAAQAAANAHLVAVIVAAFNLPTREETR